CRPFSGLCRFLLTVLGSGVGGEGGEEPAGCLCNLVYSGVEGSFVHLRGLAEATDLAYVLQGSVANFFFAGRRVKVEEGADVSTHDFPHFKSAKRWRTRWTKAPGVRTAMSG